MTKNKEEKALVTIDRSAKKRWVLEQRLLRRPYRDIADDIHVTIETVKKWILEGTAQYLPPEETEALRQMDAANIDASEARTLKRIAWIEQQAIDDPEGFVKKGQGSYSKTVWAVEEVRKEEELLAKLRQQRARLLGHEQPVQVTHNIKIRTTFDEDIEVLVSELLGGGNVVSHPNDVYLEGEIIDGQSDNIQGK